MSKSAALSNASSQEEFQALVDMKRRKRMARVDQISPELREMVNDYGLPVVTCLMDLGVTKPNQIKHVVETILDEFSPTRGSSSHQGVTVITGGFRKPDRDYGGKV
jgi:hypothetical protein